MEKVSAESNNFGSQLNQGHNSEKDFVLCSNNGSDIASVKSLDEKSEGSLDFGLVGRVNKSAHSSIGSFSEVHGLDMEPKLGRTDHGDDVSTLMADAQKDVDAPSHGAYAFGAEDASKKPEMIEMDSGNWVAGVRKYSEFDDIDPSEVQVTFDDGSDASDELTNASVGRDQSDESVKEASVSYLGITYLGSACVNAPVSELELKRTISIMRDHASISIDVILAIGLSSDGYVKLIDPQSRIDIASYDSKKIIFWGKADDESREKDCVAFNVSHGDDSFHCHVFKCVGEDTVSRKSHLFLSLVSGGIVYFNRHWFH